MKSEKLKKRGLGKIESGTRRGRPGEASGEKLTN